MMHRKLKMHAMLGMKRQAAIGYVTADCVGRRKKEGEEEDLRREEDGEAKLRRC